MSHGYSKEADFNKLKRRTVFTHLLTSPSATWWLVMDLPLPYKAARCPSSRGSLQSCWKSGFELELQKYANASSAHRRHWNKYLCCCFLKSSCVNYSFPHLLSFLLPSNPETASVRGHSAMCISLHLSSGAVRRGHPSPTLQAGSEHPDRSCGSRLLTPWGLSAYAISLSALPKHVKCWRG